MYTVSPWIQEKRRVGGPEVKRAPVIGLRGGLTSEECCWIARVASNVNRSNLKFQTGPSILSLSRLAKGHGEVHVDNGVMTGTD